MEKLTDLINISKVSEKKLNEVGIYTPEELRKTGTKKVFMMLREKDPTVCLSMLYGIHGAIENIRWCDLSDETREDLKRFYKSL
jgi:DNA transformation protein